MQEYISMVDEKQAKIAEDLRNQINQDLSNLSQAEDFKHILSCSEKLYKNILILGLILKEY